MMFNIKMRSSKGKSHEDGGKHISGFERIVKEEDVENELIQMYNRARNHEKGDSDFINIKIEKIKKEEIAYIKKLSIKQHQVNSKAEGLKLAKNLLKKNKVSEIAIENSINSLLNLKESMHGAMLIDKTTGERLDNRKEKGVRATGMGFSENTDYTKLNNINTNPSNKEDIPGIHFKEALVLATKVTSCKGIIAELCWSDDPNYVTGYIATKKTYHRIPIMKEKGSQIGGRVFFVDTSEITENYTIDNIIDYLEKQIVLVE